MSAIRKIGDIDGIIPTEEELKIVSGIYQYTQDILKKLCEEDIKLLADPDWVEFISFEVQYLLDLCTKLEASMIFWSVYDPLTRIYLRTKENFRTFPKASYLDDFKNFSKGLKQRFGEDINFPQQMIARRNEILGLSEKEPIKIKIWGKQIVWIYKGFYYYSEGHDSDEQISRLILEDFDNERQYLKGLMNLYENYDPDEGDAYYGQRIPEEVRIVVWRRDGGKCVRCGSWENLEYDHIIPLFDGGSNKAINIELLCEKCNRSKHAQQT